MFHEESVSLPEVQAALPPSEPVKVWRPSDLIAGVVLLLLGFVVAVGVSAVIVAWGHMARTDPAVALIFTVATLVAEVWAGVIVVALAVRRGVTPGDLGFRLPRTWSLVPVAVVGAYGSLIAYTAMILAIEGATGADLSYFRQGNQIPADLPRTMLIWGLLGLTVVLAAPLSEELFFRGLIYRGLAGIGGPTLGIVASGLAFSAVHGNLSVILPFALIGMIFAWAYRASGSLWTTIAAHAIFNGVNFVFSLYGVTS
ncbi:MAG: CPBP family intramembrane glutamic endopeptidase [Dehalococcoidia bacterium]